MGEAAFGAEGRRIAALPGWVIDGNYAGTLGPRCGGGGIGRWLDVPAWLSVARIAVRTAAPYGRVRGSGPAGCRERVEWAFLGFAWRWNGVRRARNLGMLSGFGGRRGAAKRPGPAAAVAGAK